MQSTYVLNFNFHGRNEWHVTYFVQKYVLFVELKFFLFINILWNVQSWWEKNNFEIKFAATSTKQNMTLHLCTLVESKFLLTKKINCNNFNKARYEEFFCGCGTMYDFHNSTDTLKFSTDKRAINKTFLFFIRFSWNLVKL